MNEEVKVKITRHAGRKYLIAYYDDPITGKREQRSTKTADETKAVKFAAVWEDELLSGRYRRDSRITWPDFRERYENEKLASLADKTQRMAETVFNHLERLIGPKHLRSLTAATLSKFQAELRKTGISETSIDAYLGHLQAALSWAVSMDMLPKMPKIQRPKKAKGRKLMRGRPITAEEFERMIAVVPKIRKRDAAAWQRYLTGLWLSGLRLEESLVLSWDDDAGIFVDLTGKHPRLRIFAEAEKGHQDRLLPMTPDLARFLLETPEGERSGPVFKLTGTFTGKPITPKRVSRIVSSIGKRAGVVVNKQQGKFASAHDLRRAFGTRWASRVKPATLQLLMRHRSIDTTMKYYVGQDADDVAAELWAAESASVGTFVGTTPAGGRCDNEPQKARSPETAGL
jgi:integrase